MDQTEQMSSTLSPEDENYAVSEKVCNTKVIYDGQNPKTE
jgi:hypothetical protein